MMAHRDVVFKERANCEVTVRPIHVLGRLIIHKLNINVIIRGS